MLAPSQPPPHSTFLMTAQYWNLQEKLWK